MLANKKRQKIIGMLFCFFILIVIFIWYNNGRKLVKSHSIGYAIIEKCEWVSRATARYVVSGRFKLGNTEYHTSCQLSCNSLKLAKLKTELIGLKVPVVYYPEDPSINYLLIENKDYAFYKVPIHDSLKWVDSFVRCQ